MSETSEKQVKLSKKKAYMMVLASGVSIAYGVWMLTLGEGVSKQLPFDDPMHAYGVAIASLLFFAACGAIGLRKALDDKPGLVFSSLGLLDNASFARAGLIPWAEIEGAQIMLVHKQKMLIVQVKDPLHYIAKGGALRQAVDRANLKLCGTPIVINANTLQADFSKVLADFQAFHARYGSVPDRAEQNP